LDAGLRLRPSSFFLAFLVSFLLEVPDRLVDKNEVKPSGQEKTGGLF